MPEPTGRCFRRIGGIPKIGLARSRPLEPEITTACMFGYLRRAEPDALPGGRYPGLDDLSSSCERHTAFIACPENYHPSEGESTA